MVRDHSCEMWHRTPIRMLRVLRSASSREAHRVCATVTVPCGRTHRTSLVRIASVSVYCSLVVSFPSLPFSLSLPPPTFTRGTSANHGCVCSGLTLYRAQALALARRPHDPLVAALWTGQAHRKAAADGATQPLVVSVGDDGVREAPVSQ